MGISDSPARSSPGQRDAWLLQDGQSTTAASSVTPAAEVESVPWPLSSPPREAPPRVRGEWRRHFGTLYGL